MTNKPKGQRKVERFLSLPGRRDVEKAANIIRDVGGRLVGRTKLQKIACLLELTGLGEGFPFSYLHYGPYSEELANAARDAAFIGLIVEKEDQAEWGGRYSIYTISDDNLSKAPPVRKELAAIAVEADSVELELAVTAAFLASQGENNAWQETVSRKPEKAKDGRLAKAQILYKKLQSVVTPKPLPNLLT